MKYLAIVALVLMTGTIGCKKAPPFIALSDEGHAAQERTAEYVRTHQCAVYFAIPPYQGWNEAEGKLETRPGFIEYQCLGLGSVILISSDEVQP